MSERDPPARPDGYGAAAARGAGRLIRAFALLVQAARLMVGLPDYDAYRRHLAAHHPDRTPMSRAAFFRDRQKSRYGGGGGRCC